MYLIKKYKILLAILVIPYIFIFYICLAQTDYEVITLGDITPVDDIIEINTDYSSEGTINSIYVMTFRATLFQKYLVDKTPKSSGSSNSGYSYLSASDYDKMGIIQHDSSVEYSLINAYSEASKIDSNVHLNYSFTGLMVEYRSVTAVDLQIGDLIVEINGTNIADVSSNEFITLYNNCVLDTPIKVLRNGSLIDYVLNSNFYHQIYCYPRYDIDYLNSYPTMQVNATNIQGPSGGLLQSISVFNQILPKDYTYGLTISGTGTINNSGSVGAIGGITQKIYTAFERDVDIFFCPTANYEEAKEAYDSIKHNERMALVEVTTFSDAIEYLLNV